MRRRSTFALVLLPGLLVWAAPASGEAPPDLDVIVHPSVPVETMDRAALAAIFSMTKRSWSGGLAAVPFNYPPENALRRAFDSAVLGLAPEEVGRFWIDQRIRGFGYPPRQVSDRGIMLRLVGNLKGAIGYVPSGTADKSVRVVARVRQGKVVPP